MPYNINSGYGAITAHAVPMGCGKVFYVAMAGSDAYEYLSRIFPTDTDGVPRVYAATAATANTAIQAALDACVAGRNDYVLVWPTSYPLATSDYTITATLTMSKANVHLLCPAGMGMGVGASWANITFIETASVPLITLSGQGCEIAGFGFIQKADYNTILISSGGHTAHIHHNFFSIRGTTGGGSLPCIQTGTGVYFTLIEKNHFSTTASGATFISVIAISNNDNGWAKILDNVIMIGDGCTATIGINSAGLKCEVSRNIVAALPAALGASAGTVTTAIVYCAGGIAVDNRLCVANTADLSGGGTYTAQNNISGGSGGAISG